MGASTGGGAFVVECVHNIQVLPTAVIECRGGKGGGGEMLGCGNWAGCGGGGSGPTCAGYCGGSGSDGSCYCDSSCVSLGDCCSDYASQCL